MKIPPKLVCVHWTDAFDSSNGWITIKEYSPKATHVISVGYLLEDNLTGHISITGSWFPSEEDEVSEMYFILEGTIGVGYNMMGVRAHGGAGQ